MRGKAAVKSVAGPEAPEPFAAPSHDGVGLHEYQRRSPVQPRLGRHDPKQPISPLKRRTLDGAFHGVELLPQREVFKNQFLVPTACQRHGSNEDGDHFQHASIVS